MEKVNVLGVNVVTENYHKIIMEVNRMIKTNKKFVIYSVNPKKVMLARQNKNLQKALIQCECPIPDGFQITRLSSKIKNRITGIDLMDKICKSQSKKKGTIFLYGSTEENILLAEASLKKKYPEIQIVGTMDGFTENKIVVDKINESQADILFVGLGSPKQEIWIEKYKNQICPKVIMGVGGSFDVVAGKVKRAPLFMQKHGLEWLYRFLKQPRRMKEIPLYIKYLILVRKEVKK